MNVFKAALAGLKGMTRSTRVVILLWSAILVSALPLTVAMRDVIQEDIGTSQMQENLRGGLDLGWLEEFHHRHEGLAQTLTPGRVSGALAWENLELWLSGGWITESRLLAATGVVFLLVWVLLQGGVIAHLSRSDSRFQIGSFLGDSGTYFFRFLRLGVFMGLGYYGVYRLAFWLFPAIEKWTRDVTVEKTVLSVNLVGALAIVIMMSLIHLVADYAKIATVLDDRRSMVLAAIHAFSQIVRHPLQSFGLMGLLFLILIFAQWVLYLAMPDVRNASVQALIFAFVVGQGYLFIRSGLRVARFGAEIALYSQWKKR